MSRQVVLDAVAELPETIVPVGFVFFFDDGRQAMLPFSGAWAEVASALDRAAATMRAKATVKAELRKHH